MAQDIATIDIQMNEFGMSLNNIDNTCNVLSTLAEEIIADFKNGKLSLDESMNCARESGLNVNDNEINKFKQDMLNNCETELKHIEDVFKNLNTIIRESKEFEELEATTRRELVTNVEQFKEANLKPLINVKKKQVNHEENPKYVKLKSLIDNLNENVTDDLIIDDTVQQNQIVKCPITGKSIENVFKHKCGHSYEREAIINYCKGRNVTKKCPYAGCTSTINMNDINGNK